MKKTILSLIALLAFSGSALAGDKPVISVADVEALPGQTVSFTVNLEDGKADTYTAMTLYAQFPATGFTTTGDYTVSTSWKGATAVIGDVDAEGKVTIPFASANTITGSAVENLVTVEFTVDAGVALGNYDVTLKGTMFEYGTDSKDYADDVTFTITVTDRITLDEASTTIPEAKSDVNVKVIRTFAANEWSTICLPFAMSEAQLKAAFGDDVKLGTFEDYDTTEDGDDVTGITINFASATAIEANTPYVIKVSTDIAEFNVDNVTIAPDEENAYVEYNNGLTGKKKVVYGTFEGTLHAGKTLTKSQIFLSGNKLWYSKGSTVIKGFRAYFDFMDILAAYDSSAPIFMSFDNEATGIKIVQAEGDDSYYDLNGRKVLNPTKKGIYIHNGKKEVVK